jgi:hypothetical protein
MLGPTRAIPVMLQAAMEAVAPRMDIVETQPIIVMLDVSQHTDFATPTPQLLRAALAAQISKILLALITNVAWLDIVALPRITVRIQEAANWDTVAATQIQLLLDSRQPIFPDL